MTQEELQEELIESLKIKIKETGDIMAQLQEKGLECSLSYVPSYHKIYYSVRTVSVYLLKED